MVRKRSRHAGQRLSVCAQRSMQGGQNLGGGRRSEDDGGRASAVWLVAVAAWALAQRPEHRPPGAPPPQPRRRCRTTTAPTSSRSARVRTRPSYAQQLAPRRPRLTPRLQLSLHHNAAAQRCAAQRPSQRPPRPPPPSPPVVARLQLPQLGQPLLQADAALGLHRRVAWRRHRGCDRGAAATAGAAAARREQARHAAPAAGRGAECYGGGTAGHSRAATPLRAHLRRRREPLPKRHVRRPWPCKA